MLNTRYIVSFFISSLISLSAFAHPQVWRGPVAVTGNTYSGKTLLSKVLRKKAFKDPRPGTFGIKINHTDNDDFKFLMIEFGGQLTFDQPISHILRQQNYMLFVVNAFQPRLDREKLKFIYQRVPNAVIQVVAGQIDEIPANQRGGLLREIQNDVENVKSELKMNILPDVILVSAKTSEGIGELQHAIHQQMETQQEHSSVVDAFIDHLWDLGRGQHYITKQEAYRLAKEHGVTESNVEDALQACHRVGVCFIPENLPDTVILHVQHFFTALHRLYYPPRTIVNIMPSPGVVTFDIATMLWQSENFDLGPRYRAKNIFRNTSRDQEEMATYYNWMTQIPLGVPTDDGGMLITESLPRTQSTFKPHFQVSAEWKDGSKTDPPLTISETMMSDLFSHLAMQPETVVHASSAFVADITEYQSGLRYSIGIPKDREYHPHNRLYLNIRILSHDERMPFGEAVQYITTKIRRLLSGPLPNVDFQLSHVACNKAECDADPDPDSMYRLHKVKDLQRSYARKDRPEEERIVQCGACCEIVKSGDVLQHYGMLPK